MKYKRFLKALATIGPFGYFVGSGTFGSLIGLILVFFTYNLITNVFFQILLILFLFFISFLVISKVINEFNSSDPSQIIIDEVLGCFVVFCGLELTIKNMIIGFVLFRLLDITKFFGISYLERFFDGPFSILIDDIVAGLITNMVLRFLVLPSY